MALIRKFVRSTASAAVIVGLFLNGSCGKNSEQKMIKKAKTKIVSEFFNPDSAQFSEIKVENQQDGTTVITGCVNAKNRLSDYVGARKFLCQFETKTGKLSICKRLYEMKC